MILEREINFGKLHAEIVIKLASFGGTINRGSGTTLNLN